MKRGFRREIRVRLKERAAPGYRSAAVIGRRIMHRAQDGTVFIKSFTIFVCNEAT